MISSKETFINLNNRPSKMFCTQNNVVGICKNQGTYSKI